MNKSVYVVDLFACSFCCVTQLCLRTSIFLFSCCVNAIENSAFRFVSSDLCKGVRVFFVFREVLVVQAFICTVLKAISEIIK